MRRWSRLLIALAMVFVFRVRTGDQALRPCEVRDYLVAQSMPCASDPMAKAALADKILPAGWTTPMDGPVISEYLRAQERIERLAGHGGMEIRNRLKRFAPGAEKLHVLPKD